jgi:hypothetical protein
VAVNHLGGILHERKRKERKKERTKERKKERKKEKNIYKNEAILLSDRRKFLIL